MARIAAFETRGMEQSAKVNVFEDHERELTNQRFYLNEQLVGHYIEMGYCKACKVEDRNTFASMKTFIDAKVKPASVQESMHVLE